MEGSEKHEYVIEYQHDKYGEGWIKLKALEDSGLDLECTGEERPPRPAFIINCSEHVLEQVKARFPWIMSVRPYKPMYVELVDDFED